MKCVLVTIAMISTLATIASVPLIHNGIGSEGEFQYIPKEDENGVITVPVQINSENGREYKLMEDEGVDRLSTAVVQRYQGESNRLHVKTPSLNKNVAFLQNPAGTVGRWYSSDGSQIANIFKTIEGALSEDVVSSTKAIFTFDVTGDDGGKWHIDLKNGAGSVGVGDKEGSDVTLTLSSENFVKMFSGQLNPTQAFMSGKLKIKGNMGKAMALEKLMKKLK